MPARSNVRWYVGQSNTSPAEAVLSAVVGEADGEDGTALAGGVGDGPGAGLLPLLVQPAATATTQRAAAVASERIRT